MEKINSENIIKIEINFVFIKIVLHYRKEKILKYEFIEKYRWVIYNDLYKNVER